MRSTLILRPDARELSPQAFASGASALELRLGAASTRALARTRARAFIDMAAGVAPRPKIFVRIAPVDNPESDADLACVVRRGLDGVFLEGCGGRADVQALSQRLAVREAENGLAPGSVKIVALAAQTPAAVFALGGYAGASARLVALAMDDAALPGGDAARVVARSLLVMAAAAAGVAALCVLRGDLAESGAEARQSGFSGLMTESVEEIGVVERIFGSP